MSSHLLLGSLPHLRYTGRMQKAGFEAFAGRIEEMLDACTRCGACFTACPIAAPAGIADADPKAVISGVLNIVRAGAGPETSQKWAKACMQSGECIKACHYGVNPRCFSRLPVFSWRSMRPRRPASANGRAELPKNGRDEIGVLSRLQLSDEALERLGQKPASRSTSEELPDVVFYTGCNVLKTPHIASYASTSWTRLASATTGNGRTEPLLWHRPVPRWRPGHVFARFRQYH